MRGCVGGAARLDGERGSDVLRRSQRDAQLSGGLLLVHHKGLACTCMHMRHYAQATRVLHAHTTCMHTPHACTTCMHHMHARMHMHMHVHVYVHVGGAPSKSRSANVAAALMRVSLLVRSTR